MSRPVAVLTGDMHFNIQTLELASSALWQLLAKAKELNVPAVLNGDTLDQKAIVRGEIANRLIEILEPEDPTRIYINRGNHDQLHERVTEHSLNFLRPYAQVISAPTFIEEIGSWIVPYSSDNVALQAFLDTVPKGSRLIMHQGLMGADLGHYVKDSSSLPSDSFADFRTILSHYHRRQNLKCGKPRKGAVGLASYIGSPYSISFTEAGDGPKGINVLYDDGSLELIPTNLRKHVVLDWTTERLSGVSSTARGNPPEESAVNSCDLVWLKLRGPASELAALKKADLANLIGVEHFKFDKIITETEALDDEEKAEALTGEAMLDALIDKSDEPAAEKALLKSTWRQLVSV